MLYENNNEIRFLKKKKNQVGFGFWRKRKIKSSDFFYFMKKK
jgi:hypothetical protein